METQKMYCTSCGYVEAQEGTHCKKCGVCMTSWIDTAKQQAVNQLARIHELVRLTQEGTRDFEGDEKRNEAREEIQNDPLEILVRSGWYSLGDEYQSAPAYYSILLATGGPAVRIRGRLHEGQPETAQLEYQDWGTPWTRLPLTKEDIDVLLAYAQCFYFGE